MASGSVSASDEPGRTHGASSTWANGPYHSPSTRIEKRSAAAAAYAPGRLRAPVLVLPSSCTQVEQAPRELCECGGQAV